MCILLGMLFGSHDDEHKDKKRDMWDYQHEDDFYESNKDNFDSFEEAEEYYFRHGGR